jgi:type II secretory pathway pseudopilin PulG
VKRSRALHRRQEGFIMAALLVAMAVMMIAMTAALPAWQTAARREKEAELIFRGKQYGRAIGAYQRKYGGAYPPTVDVLIDQRFLRKKYKDPIANDDFVFVGPGSELPTTSTGPQGVGASTRPNATGGSSTLQTPAGSGRLGSTSSLSTQTSIGGGMTLGGTSTGQSTQGGRTGSTSSSTSSSSTTQGIMAVYSKSKDKALRVYNGYDHYNEWLFTGTQATQTVTSPNGGQTPGQGTRGGAAGTRGGAPTGGRGTQPGGGGFGGRGGGPGGANPFGGGAGGTTPFGGAPGVPNRGGR